MNKEQTTKEPTPTERAAQVIAGKQDREAAINAIMQAKYLPSRLRGVNGPR